MTDFANLGKAAYTAYTTQIDAAGYEAWDDLTPDERRIWINVAATVAERINPRPYGIQVGDGNSQHNVWVR